MYEIESLLIKEHQLWKFDPIYPITHPIHAVSKNEKTEEIIRSNKKSQV